MSNFGAASCLIYGAKPRFALASWEFFAKKSSASRDGLPTPPKCRRLRNDHALNLAPRAENAAGVLPRRRHVHRLAVLGLGKPEDVGDAVRATIGFAPQAFARFFA